MADELQKDSGYQKVRYVTSDDRTCSEIASILGAGIGQPDLRWTTLPPEDVLKSLLARGLPEKTTEVILEIGLATHKGILRGDYELSKPVFGKVKIADFAEEFAAVYLNA